MTIALDDSSARRITPTSRQHFFGYFDRCPWDASDRYALTLRVAGENREPRADDRVTICLVDTMGDEPLREMAESCAWNFQQGSMQQWLPATGAETFIHNDRRNGAFVSVIRDIDGRELTQLPQPIYHVSADACWALTLNFSRLARTRPGYGYAGVPDLTREELCPSQDGVRRMDLRSGVVDLILPLREIADHDPIRGMSSAEHWCNHLLFNPSGTRFAFVHRWGNLAGNRLANSVVKRRPKTRLGGNLRSVLGATYRKLTGRGFTGHQSRLFTANSDGTDLRCQATDGMVSHYSWRDDHHLLAWMRKSPIGDRYWLIDDRTGDTVALGERVLTRDGHCTYSPDRRWFLTDTYPDEQHRQWLILFNTETSQRVDIGAFGACEHLKGEIRCDLHPRFDHSGLRVCFDSAHEGTRQLYMMDVSRWTAS